MNVQAGHPRDPSISTPSEQHRLEPREETPLALVEQAEKQHQGSLALIECAVASLLQRRRRTGLPGQDLGPASGRVSGAVEIRHPQLLAAQTLVSNQLQQRILHLHLDDPSQLRCKQALLGIDDEPRARVHQRTEAREVDVSVRPESALVEARHLVERVVPATVGIARAVWDRPELSEHRHIDRGAEGRFELIHGGDPLSAQ